MAGNGSAGGGVSGADGFFALLHRDCRHANRRPHVRLFAPRFQNLALSLSFIVGIAWSMWTSLFRSHPRANVAGNRLAESRSG